MNKGMFTSISYEWETSKYLFNALNKKYNFTLDLCANENNKLCKKYFTIGNSCLNKKIKNEIIFCNSPYERKIKEFIKKCYDLKKYNKIIVMLLPARTDTIWFHDYIYIKSEILFLKGRLKFSNSKNSAPFPIMIVIYRKDNYEN